MKIKSSIFSASMSPRRRRAMEHLTARLDEKNQESKKHPFFIKRKTGDDSTVANITGKASLKLKTSFLLRHWISAFSHIAGEPLQITIHEQGDGFEGQTLLEIWTSRWDDLCEMENEWNIVALLKTQIEMRLVLSTFAKMGVITRAGHQRAAHSLNTVIEVWLYKLCQKEGDEAMNITVTFKGEDGAGIMNASRTFH